MNFKFLKVLASVWTWFKFVFKKADVKQFAEDIIDPAINIVQAVKAAIESDTVDWLVNLTPTDRDNKFIDRAEDMLAKAIKRLYDVKKWGEDQGELSAAEIIKIFIDKMKEEDKNVQNALLSKVASNIGFNESRFKGKFTPKEFEIDTLTAMRYADRKEKETV